ncbi:MAG: type II toxin-antitoxin system VapC family toxin [Rhodoferax sp.]
MYLLDTNICAYFLSRKYPAVAAKFRLHEPNDLAISSIVAGELAYGVENSTRIETNRLALKLFLSKMTVLPWDEAAIWHFGVQKTRLKKAGTKIGELDLLIGCQALALDAVLVTNNTREFERIDGLKLENWVA